MSGSQVEISTLEKKIESIQEGIVNEKEIEQLASDLCDDTEETEVISDLFYNSVKSLFDFGFELAKSLFTLDEFSKKEEPKK